MDTLHFGRFNNDEWEILKLIFSSLLAIGSGLLIFFLGRFSERLKERKRLNNIRDSFFNDVNHWRTQLKFDEDYLITHQSEIDKDLTPETMKMDTIPAYIDVSMNPKFIDNYKLEDLYRVFITKRWTKKEDRIDRYNTLIRGTQAMKDIYSIYMTAHLDLSESLRTRTNQIIEQINILDNAMTEYIVSIVRKKNLSDPIDIFKMNVLLIWNKEKKTDQIEEVLHKLDEISIQYNKLVNENENHEEAKFANIFAVITRINMYAEMFYNSKRGYRVTLDTVYNGCKDMGEDAQNFMELEYKDKLKEQKSRKSVKPTAV